MFTQKHFFELANEFFDGSIMIFHTLAELNAAILDAKRLLALMKQENLLELSVVVIQLSRFT